MRTPEANGHDFKTPGSRATFYLWCGLWWSWCAWFRRFCWNWHGCGVTTKTKLVILMVLTFGNCLPGVPLWSFEVLCRACRFLKHWSCLMGVPFLKEVVGWACRFFEIAGHALSGASKHWSCLPGVPLLELWRRLGFEVVCWACLFLGIETVCWACLVLGKCSSFCWTCPFGAPSWALKLFAGRALSLKLFAERALSWALKMLGGRALSWALKALELWRCLMGMPFPCLFLTFEVVCCTCPFMSLESAWALKVFAGHALSVPCLELWSRLLGMCWALKLFAGRALWWALKLCAGRWALKLFAGRALSWALKLRAGHAFSMPFHELWSCLLGVPFLSFEGVCWKCPFLSFWNYLPGVPLSEGAWDLKLFAGHALFLPFLALKLFAGRDFLSFEAVCWACPFLSFEVVRRTCPFLSFEIVCWASPRLSFEGAWALKPFAGHDLSVPFLGLWSCVLGMPYLELWNCLLGVPFLELWSCLQGVPFPGLWSCLPDVPFLELWNCLLGVPFLEHWSFVPGMPFLELRSCVMGVPLSFEGAWDWKLFAGHALFLPFLALKLLAGSAFSWAIGIVSWACPFLSFEVVCCACPFLSFGPVCWACPLLSFAVVGRTKDQPQCRSNKR